VGVVVCGSVVWCGGRWWGKGGGGVVVGVCVVGACGSVQVWIMSEEPPERQVWSQPTP